MLNERDAVLYTDSVDAYIEDVKNYSFLSFEQEQSLATSKRPYINLVKHYASNFPTIRGEMKSPDEKAEIHISGFMAKKMYPGSDFFDIVTRGKEAINQFVNSYSSLVVIAAKKFRPFSAPSFNFGDMLGVGGVALRRAAFYFDADSVRFSTYAEPCIRREIAREMRRYREGIGVSEKKMKDVRYYRKVFEELYESNQTEPTPEEVSEAAKIKGRRLASTMAAIAVHKVLSLDVLFQLEGDLSLNPEEKYIAKEEKTEKIKVLGVALGSLSPRKKTILYHRFGFGDKILSQRETGKLLRISHARVYQLEKAAIEDLKINLGA